MVLVGGLGNKCFTLCCLRLAQPSVAHGQPMVTGRGARQVSRGCLVCVYRRESRLQVTVFYRDVMKIYKFHRLDFIYF